MAFLYRIPLFDVDPNDPVAISDQKEKIIEAIQLASPEFAKLLASKDFMNLEDRLRIKLRKYLLRAKYRPTPFGKFAGVGIADWGNTFHLEHPLKATELNNIHYHSRTSDPLSNQYKLTEGIYLKHGFYHAMVYDRASQKWSPRKIPYNNLLKVLFKKFKNRCFDFNQFKELTEKENQEAFDDLLKELWLQLIDSGILVHRGIQLENQNGTDMVLKNPVTVPCSIKQTLQEFIESAGNLFSEEETRYLHEYKKWQIEHFDDRWISLQQLMENGDFFSGQFLLESSVPNEETIDFSSKIFENNGPNSIDLKKNVAHKNLDRGIFDIQLLYRMDEQENPVIENIVCNRPFVYTGRFNRDAAVKNLTLEIKNKIFQNEHVLYAHLNFIENKSIEHICAVENIFDYEIGPYPPNSPKELAFRDLFLGIEQNRIILFHKPSKKQVIPIVLHPLNGVHITHPLLRLLWEVAHQGRFRFKPYQSNNLEKAAITPALCWGKLCLQPKKWKLKKDKLETLESLQRKLHALDLPKHILVGKMDQELLLSLENPDDLQILREELNKHENLVLSEAHWFHSNGRKNKKRPLQLVYQHSRTKDDQFSPIHFNPITKAIPDCFYLIIVIKNSEVPEVLQRLFLLLKKLEYFKSNPTWYFLIYGKNQGTEIRLRILDFDSNKSPLLLNNLEGLFRKENWEWKTATYFPETSKYGKRSLPISHKIFHLESSFLAKKHGKDFPIMHSDKSKILLIVSLWKKIVIQSPESKSLFKLLQKETKIMDTQIVQAYKKEFQFSPEAIQSRFNQKSYFSLILSHPYFKRKGAVHSHFLMNHLHMMCNRFFPTAPLEQERRIRYHLYREMGKHLYTLSNQT
ncbi:thiopeptide-type bacteriocin biosynthesis protein [Algoriphagus aestuarii]|nr:thiopeptide-type bacteriocin biosynthesis protein [Algoriphagus aestuarii]